MPDRAEQLLAALLIEAAMGYPNALHRRVPHPVVWAGALISTLERRWNGQHSSFDAQTSKRESRWIPTFAGMTREAKNRLAGVATVAILVLAATFFGLILEHLFSGWPGVLLLILVATTGLAQKSLHDHVRAVAEPLLAGNIGEARTALSKIVGRDTTPLDESGIAAAATESLAESLGDGIVTPAFWFLVAGLPGIFVFKAVSTADSLIGHKDERYRHFGWAAARLDDVMNFVPARLSGLLLCLSSPSFLRRQGARFFFGGAKGNGVPACAGTTADLTPHSAVHVMLRDARKHLSPNAGWPEAAMAGALGVTLGGGASYDGEWIGRATLGDGLRPQPQDLACALALYRRACLLLWLIVGGLAWAL